MAGDGNFEQVVDKARDACRNAGHSPQDHFADVGKMVDLGSGAQRRIEDVALTWYSAYLIAQNGDPKKEAIAFAQTFLATYQLVWAASQQRDLTSALAHAERYASGPNAKPNQRAEGRWAAAVVTQQLGSPEQARAAFDGWLQQFGADPELQKLVLDVQTRRAKL